MTTHRVPFVAPTAQELLDAVPASAVVVDRAGSIRLANQRWVQFCVDEGGRPEAVSPPADYLAACGRDVADGIRAVLNQEIDRLEIEYPCHGPTTERWFRMIVTPLEAGALIVHEDITGEYERVSRWLATTPSPIIELGPDGDAVFVNQAWAHLQQTPARALLGAHWADHLRHEDGERLISALRATTKDRTDRTVEIPISTPDDGTVWLRFLISAYDDHYGRLRRVSLIGIDVTAARLLDDQRAASAERDRIAADIHDVVIQDLIGIGRALDVARRRGTADSDFLSEVTRSLDDSIADLRSLTRQLPSHRLRPTDIDAVTRQAALALGFAPDVQIDVDLSHVSNQLATNLLLVIKEALSNVAQHAHATSASVSVREDHGGLVLTVRDDGVGMPVQSTRSSGTANIANRAADLGGTARWSRGPDGGTVLEWHVPLSDQRRSA